MYSTLWISEFGFVWSLNHLKEDNCEKAGVGFRVESLGLTVSQLKPLCVIKRVIERQ